MNRRGCSRTALANRHSERRRGVPASTTDRENGGACDGPAAIATNGQITKQCPRYRRCGRRRMPRAARRGWWSDRRGYRSTTFDIRSCFDRGRSRLPVPFPIPPVQGIHGIVNVDMRDTLREKPVSIRHYGMSLPHDGAEKVAPGQLGNPDVYGDRRTVRRKRLFTELPKDLARPSGQQRVGRRQQGSVAELPSVQQLNYLPSLIVVGSPIDRPPRAIGSRQPRRRARHARTQAGLEHRLVQARRTTATAAGWVRR